MIRRVLALMLAAAAVGCAPPAPPLVAPERVAQEAQRIVSLDYCADQYVLKLADRSRILALSTDSDRDFSYMRGAAEGLPQVAPRAEDVLVLKPDLIVRSYGGGAGAEALFARAGVPVLQLGFAGTIAEVREEVVRVADALGEGARGQAVAADMDRRLSALRRANDGTRDEALYLTPGGVTSGPGTLVAGMIEAAGLQTFEKEPGWRPIPLERLAYDRPDVVAAAAFGSGAPDLWSAARHPLAASQLEGRRVVELDGALTACGGWFLIDAVETLAREAGR